MSPFAKRLLERRRKDFGNATKEEALQIAQEYETKAKLPNEKNPTNGAYNHTSAELSQQFFLYALLLEMEANEK